MKNKQIAFLLFLSLNFGISTSFAQEKPLIKFGLIADTQYADFDTSGTRFYRNALNKLRVCVTDLNLQKVRFTITLGDLVDRNPNDLDSALYVLNQLESKVYNTTGNHDYVGITNNKELYKRLGMPSEYYSFDKGNWTFIMLNTNEIAAYANVSGTWKEQELATMQARIEEMNRDNGARWNGGISSKQMKWLKKTLDKAQKKNKNVLVFTHHPLFPPIAYTALNDQEILSVLENYQSVKAVISGHHHEGAYGKYKHIPCITTEGMVETEYENAYSVVEIFENEVVINGKGRSKSYRIPLDE